MGTAKWDGICIFVLPTARLSGISGPTYKSRPVSTNTQGNRDTDKISELQSLGVAGAEHKNPNNKKTKQNPKTSEGLKSSLMTVLIFMQGFSVRSESVI